MKKDYPYETHLDIKFKPLELVDVPAVINAVAASAHPWFNQTLCQVMQGEFLIDLEGRTRALKRAVILMVEGAGIVPTGD